MEGSVIVEVKAIEKLAPVHVRQLQTYLRLSGCPLGLIVNFGAVRLTDGVERQVNNFPGKGRRRIRTSIFMMAPLCVSGPSAEISCDARS